MTKKKTTVANKESVAGQFGFAVAVIDSDKELTELFNLVTAQYKDGKEWTQSKFNIALKKTDWYKKRTKQQRDYYVLSKDPGQKAEFDAQIKANSDNLAAVAKSMGAVLDAKDLDRLAHENAKNGWNTAQVTQVITKYIGYKKDPKNGIKALFGAAGGVETAIRDFAKSMGVGVTDGFVLEQAKNSSLGGSPDLTYAKDFIRARAKEKYSAYANDLDNATLEDLSYNFRQSMASTLEMDTVDYTDKSIQYAMINGDGNGGKLSVTDFEKRLRKDPRWFKTANAKESTQGVVNNILSSFGLS